jgi:hypothetical protein
VVLAGFGTFAAIGGAAILYTAMRPKAAPVVLQLNPPSVQFVPGVTPIPLAQNAIPERVVETPRQAPHSTLPDKTTFPFPRMQYATVPPMTKQTVFLGQFPQAYAAIVQYVGNTYDLAFAADGVTPLLTLNWTIDGDLVEAVQRIIADINSLRLLDPPYLATREIRWIAVNNHPTLSANVVIVQDGYMQKRAPLTDG